MNLALGVVTTVKPLEIKWKFSTTVFMFQGIFFAMFVLVELSLIMWKKNSCNQTE